MNLKALRKERQLTQQALGSASGLDQSSISRIENGKQAVTLAQLQQIAAALELTPAELVRRLEAA